MNTCRLGLTVLLAWLVMSCTVQAAEAEKATMWPKSKLAEFVFAHLDLSSFRNSTGPRRKIGQRFLSDLGIHPDKLSEGVAASDTPDWTYTVQILGQRDYNRDGVEELAICFSDKAGEGTYNTSTPLLVQLLEGRVVALAYDINGLREAADCKNPG